MGGQNNLCQKVSRCVYLYRSAQKTNKIRGNFIHVTSNYYNYCNTRELSRSKKSGGKLYLRVIKSVPGLTYLGWLMRLLSYFGST